MKKVGILCVIVFLSVGFYSSSIAKDNVGSNTHELQEIVRVMEREQITIDSWSVYTRGSLGFVNDFKGYQEIVSALNGKVNHLKLGGISQKKEYWEVTAVNNPKPGLEEQLTILAYPQKSHYKTYLIYEVKGKDWEEREWSEYYRQFNQNLAQIFQKTPQIFTCVKGYTTDKMNIALYEKSDELIQAFSAQTIEGIKEENFVSLSAYNENWKQSIQTQDSKMNIQISLRDVGMGGNTAVTIGTPIITTEY
jgi:hypothetical protein